MFLFFPVACPLFHVTPLLVATSREANVTWNGAQSYLLRTFICGTASFSRHELVLSDASHPVALLLRDAYSYEVSIPRTCSA